VRTYLIDEDKNELVIDITRTIVHSSEMVEFHYAMLEDNNFVKEEKIFVRRLSGQYFSSFDKVCWKKLARQDLPKHISDIDKVYNVFRGYKPSGLSTGQEGELLTQMPGKVIKIIVKEGEKVEKGQTVIILEAMKMENEIKSPTNGTISDVHIKEGQALEQNVLMMEINPE